VWPTLFPGGGKGAPISGKGAAGSGKGAAGSAAAEHESVGALPARGGQ